MTNFEKIKEMDKETLAAYLYSLGNADEYCASHCAFWKKCTGKCREGHLKWLDSEDEGCEDFSTIRW